MNTLQDICLLITDGKHGDCQDEDGSGFYFVSCKDVRDGWIDYSGARQITEADYLDTHRRTQLEADDIVITNSGTIGRMALVPNVPETNRTTFQKSVAIVKPNQKKVVPQWLYYSLMANRDALIGWAGGTAQKNLLLRDMRAFNVYVPPLPTQRKIAAILSAYDDLIENNTRRIAILEEMARLLYHEWFVRFRFPGHEQVRMVDSALGPVPEGWAIKQLGKVIELAYGKGLRKSDRIPGPYPVYGSSGVVGYHKDSLVGGPGIIVGRKGNVGSVFWSDEDFYPIDTAFYVQTDVSLHYVYYNLQYQNFISTDTAVPGLSRNQAYLLPFLLPGTKVLQEFQDFIDPIFRQIGNLRLKNTTLRQARDLLLPRLVAGEVDVVGLDIDTGGLS